MFLARVCVVNPTALIFQLQIGLLPVVPANAIPAGRRKPVG